ncbi:helix-turn-helix domain-containing protein [Oceanithermus sp.]|uniref:helix-turn-helix domain-containing protein n=1 Tax=Oceanithermus sp. TaxID=2268145 RepID=UPI002580E127|nr:helix-turn-helix domain-containing protein [Oceanithermus sp.]
MGSLHDGRIKNFWWGPNALVDDGHLERMGPHAVSVYVALLRYSDNDRRSWPKVETLERLTGISRAQVYRALARLEELGYVSRERDGRRNVYHLLQLPTASPADPPVKQVSGRDVSSEKVSERDPSGKRVSDRDKKGLRQRRVRSQTETYGDTESARPGREKLPQNADRRKQIEKDLGKKTTQEEEEEAAAHENLRKEPPPYAGVFATPAAMKDAVLHAALRGAPERRIRMLADLVEAGVWEKLRALARENRRGARAWHDWLDQLSRQLEGRPDGLERLRQALEALTPDIERPFAWVTRFLSTEAPTPSPKRAAARNVGVGDGVEVDMRGVYMED